MKRNLLACLTAGLILQLFVFAFPHQIFAQAALPQIALSVSEASPGATIEVEGGRFDPDAIVSFYLFHSGGQVQLGGVLADDHGEFLSSVFLPLSLEPGSYEFHAIDENNRVTAAPLAIIADVSGQAQDGQRAEDDLLLAPMPTYTSPTLAAPTAAMPASPVSAQPRSSIPWALVAAGAAGAALVVGLSVRKRRR
jgi:hypothetical protein